MGVRRRWFAPGRQASGACRARHMHSVVRQVVLVTLLLPCRSTHNPSAVTQSQTHKIRLSNRPLLNQCRHNSSGPSAHSRTRIATITAKWAPKQPDHQHHRRRCSPAHPPNHWRRPAAASHPPAPAGPPQTSAGRSGARCHCAAPAPGQTSPCAAVGWS